MAKVSDNDILNKSVDWGLDPTNNLPYSGRAVQKFIKEQLNGKAGVFYYDVTNNRYLVFTDAEARDEYISDPTQTGLILGTFDAPFNYTAEISLASPSYNAVFLGSKGNYIDFTFDIKNKQGASTGENVNITYTFIRNSVKRIVRETRKSGDAVHFSVDDYIDEGTNTIVVGIAGQTTLAATTASITYQVVDLQLTDETDISTVYDLTGGPQIAEIPFTISGYGTKIMEWYLDGVQLEYVKAEDEVIDVSVTRTKFITLLNLQQGRHSLQIRAYTIINGEKFYTDTLYRDLMVYTGADSNLIIGVAGTIPRAYGVLGASDALAIYDMTQYIPYTLRFGTYSPSNAASTEVSVIVDGETKGTIGSANGIENEFSLVSNTSGTKSLVLQAGDVSYEIGLVVSGTTMDLEEITNALAFDFNALGKSNNSSDKDSWLYGNYTGTFSGFNWNATSGWVHDRLEINAGASFAVNYAPLSGTPTSLGKTIEMEWSTKNVINDDAIICDLRGEDGTGILITATKVSLISRGGVVIETEYKSNENVRVGFVINRASGSTNQRLSFIYANGIVSRCEAWAIADSYTSDAEIAFSATEEVEVSLKAIRVYDSALTSDQMLNNFILYRDSISDMMSVYDRNDVYEEGTTVFSPEKMSSRLPVMIVTGDIPVLENTSDKDTQIVVDIEYTNLQDPTRNFRMVGAAMRPQGTSSMGYPKKNFRIYTQKVDDTILYDADGNVVEDKLYAFKEGSQPVNCWCLKADYAESSGTHNTGIARLWNKALYDARVTYSFGDGDSRNINNATVLRTNAQQMAVNNGYPYDVRTAIDGFPILLFYRPSANDDLIFIGKYNFNNDKSTESVFGFTFPEGVGMDEWVSNYGSTMQCWEILNNGNDLALFTTVEGFDAGWSEAFEGRYPDKNTNVADLKTFCTWMSSVAEADFATEKWEHLDVYKIAAYWVYLMRHAGADQFVKNAMFTSEDGVKWYFILYDNDTINGLINTGRIAVKPTDDRQSIDATGAYLFAGHDSRLWNMLETDEEFLAIASAVDNALYSAGISYINAIKTFDEEQAEKWVERVYNQDAQYKYIGTFVEDGINNLFMLQGKRDLHRRWWLAKRYSIFDAKYITGPYKSSSVEIKCNETAAGQKFTITAGYPLEYGYGINNIPRESGVSLDVGESYTFVTQEEITLGDPIRIYGSPNIAELDFSEMGSRLTKVDVSGCYDDALGTMLKRLVIGKSGVTNNAVFEFSGLPRATKLEYLDVQGIKGITSLDLSNHPYFKTLKAIGSNVSSVQLAKGAPVETLELPASMRVLNLEQFPYLSHANVSFEDIKLVTSISVSACPNVSNDFDFVKNWMDSKEAPNPSCSLIMDNVDWKDVGPDELIEFGSLGYMSLKGTIVLSSINLDQINSLIEIFGESVFAKGGELYIDAPNSVFVIGRTSLLEGESEEYKVLSFGSEVISTNYVIYGTTPVGVTLDGNKIITTETGSDRSFTLRVIVRAVDGTEYSDTLISVARRIYPTSQNTTIVGSDRVNLDIEEYVLSYPEDVNGDFVTNWTLSVDTEGYIEIDSYDDDSCRIKKLQDSMEVVNATLTATLTKRYNGAALFTLTKSLELVNDTIAETDAGVVAALYNAGLCASDKYLTKEEAARIIPVDLNPLDTASGSIFRSYIDQIKSFNGLQYFTSLDEIPAYTFGKTNSYYTEFKSVKFPPSLKRIGDYAFSNCYLEHVGWNDGLEEIGDYAFENNRVSGSMIIPEGVTSIGYRAFYSSTFEEFIAPSTLSTLGEGALERNECLRIIDLSKSNITTYDATNISVNSSGVVQGGNISLETIYFPSTIREIKRWCLAQPTLKNVYCPCSTPPTANTYGDSAFEVQYSSVSKIVYAGRDVPQQERMLYVPTNATGYSTSTAGWQELLSEDMGNFNISATL